MSAETKSDAAAAPLGSDSQEAHIEASALHLFRDYVDAFNRLDHAGIRQVFHDLCRTCHPDNPHHDIGVPDSSGEGEGAGEHNDSACPGERIALRLYKLASSGVTINVVRAFATPTVDESPTSGTSAMFAEIQLIRNGSPFLSECVIYSAALGKCISYTVYLLKTGGSPVYSKILPAFRGWGTQENGLEPPRQCSRGDASKSSQITIVCCNGWGSLHTEGWMKTVVPLLASRGAKIIAYDKRPKDDTVENHVLHLTEILASHKVGETIKWEDLWFLGQSAGNQIIVRYLSTLPKDIRIGGYFGVAAWFKLLNPRSNLPRAAAWDGFMDKFGTELSLWENQESVNFERARTVCHRCEILISDDDPIVNQDDSGAANCKLWQNRLGAKVHTVQSKQHFIFIEHLQQEDLYLILRFFGLALV